MTIGTAIGLYVLCGVAVLLLCEFMDYVAGTESTALERIAALVCWPYLAIGLVWMVCLFPLVLLAVFLED